MAISTAYQTTLKRRAIQRFVTANNRAPTETELRQLIQTEQAAYPNVDRVGVIGYDSTRPQFREVSSVAKENTNRVALLDDMRTLSTRLDNIGQKLEDSFRGFYAVGRQSFEELDRLEDQVDTLLLLNGSVDVFVAGIHEDFHHQDKVVWDSTTAQVENGYVTLGRTGYSAVDLTDAVVTASVVSERGVLSANATEDLTTLKEDDGRFWEFLASTTYSQGRVSLVLEVVFDSPIYVGDVRLYLSPIAGNKPLTGSLFYSLDGQTYTAAEPVEAVIDQQEVQFNVGKSQVHKVQVVLTKEAADTVTSTRNQWVYLWMLDSLKVFTDTYKANTSSTVVLGPYEVESAQGESVLFTKAKLEACVVQPTDTSVNFYLSTDGTTYVPAAYAGDSLDYISFGDATRSGHMSLHDGAQDATALIEQPGTLELNFADEAVLNAYIPLASVAKVPLRGITLQRNTVGSSSPTELLQAVPGWTFDSETGLYTTTAYVRGQEGRYIDFGPKPVVVNGQGVSGRVFLPQGYSVVSVTDDNWKTVSVTAGSADDLRQADSLYPYNHKMLIEGYAYNAAFRGERVYTGADSYFGSLLTYLPPEVFDRLDETDSRYWTSFTFVDTQAGRYLKIKVKKTDSSWSSELVTSDWIVQSRNDNQLYVKAILNSSDAGCSPQIDSFKVMVI